MKAPFNLPVRAFNQFLMTSDAVAIANINLTTQEERAYIVKAINNHDKLVAQLADLLRDVLELSVSPDDDALPCARQCAKARNLLESLK